MLDHGAGGVAVHDMADFVREHADQRVVAQAVLRGRLGQSVGHDHTPAGQREGIGAHALAELQLQARRVAAVARRQGARLRRQRIEALARLGLAGGGQGAGFQRALVHLLHGAVRQCGLPGDRTWRVSLRGGPGRAVAVEQHQRQHRGQHGGGQHGPAGLHALRDARAVAGRVHGGLPGADRLDLQAAVVAQVHHDALGQSVRAPGFGPIDLAKAERAGRGTGGQGMQRERGPRAPADSPTSAGWPLLLSPSYQRAGTRAGAPASGRSRRVRGRVGHAGAVRQGKSVSRSGRGRPRRPVRHPRRPAAGARAWPATWSTPPLMCRVTDSSFMRYSLTRANGR